MILPAQIDLVAQALVADVSGETHAIVRILKYSSRKWMDRIKPLEGSTVFEVKIMYRNELPPKVFLIDPMPAKGTKHLYKDGSLCLYYPPDWEWSMHKSLAMTIVPWTYVWLYFYEVWL